MNHRLIIIDGHSTVGKSTLSKSIFKQIDKQEQAYWLHEECENHPIRDGEFEAGDIHSLEGMELNMKLMLQKWKRLVETVLNNKKVYVLEGCFLHSLDRYILQSAWNEEQINNYFRQIMNILMPLNPFVVFLYRPNIKESFEKAFKLRGDQWKNIILQKPQPYGYFKDNKYTGDESIFRSLLYEQEQMKKVLNLLSCDKHKVDTSNEQWDNYVYEITKVLGYKYYKEENELPQIGKYCGTYKLKDGEYTWSIDYDNEKKCMYTSLFWPFMPMEYLSDDIYELISFPVTLHFDSEGEMIKFTVNGNYDWKLNGKTFIKMNNQ